MPSRIRCSFGADRTISEGCQSELSGRGNGILRYRMYCRRGAHHNKIPAQTPNASLRCLSGCMLLPGCSGNLACLSDPYGAVRIQINPDLKLTVNRLDYVISADGLNDDGLRLLDGCQFRGQKLEQASDELADRAMEMGYLKEGGQIFLTLESSHENWIAKTEDRLLTELENHLNDTVSVTVSAASEAPVSAEPSPQVHFPMLLSSPALLTIRLSPKSPNFRK